MAGPYRSARGEWYVRENIHKAELAAAEIWAMGGIALCPHKNTSGFGGVQGIEDYTWLEGDLELLRRCDALFALEGWDDSEGASREVREAREIYLPIFREMGDLNDFLHPEMHGFVIPPEFKKPWSERK